MAGHLHEPARRAAITLAVLLGVLAGATIDQGGSPGFALWLVATVLACTALVIVLRGGPAAEQPRAPRSEQPVPMPHAQLLGGLLAGGGSRRAIARAQRANRADLRRVLHRAPPVGRLRAVILAALAWVR